MGTESMAIHTSLSDSPQVMALRQTVEANCLKEAFEQTKKGHISDQLTILIKYDGLCPLCYSTNLLKNGCLACISPPNDKDAKVWASIAFPEDCNMHLRLIWI